MSLGLVLCLSLALQSSGEAHLQTGSLLGSAGRLQQPHVSPYACPEGKKAFLGLTDASLLWVTGVWVWDGIC